MIVEKCFKAGTWTGKGKFVKANHVSTVAHVKLICSGGYIRVHGHATVNQFTKATPAKVSRY